MDEWIRRVVSRCVFGGGGREGRETHSFRLFQLGFPLLLSFFFFFFSFPFLSLSRGSPFFFI